MRKFSLTNDKYEISEAIGSLFDWDMLDTEVAHQIGFEEQYLQFHRYLLENLCSVPVEHPEYHPRQIDLSLRAGAIKAYIVLACSIIEAVLASWAKQIGLSNNVDRLMRLPFGALLDLWSMNGEPRLEIAPIWGHLNLLLQYRNFIHLGRAITDQSAYWKNILDRERDLLSAVDMSLNYLSSQCCRNHA